MLLRIMEEYRRSYSSFLHGTLTALAVERAQITLVLADINDLQSNLIPLPQHKFRMMKVHAHSKRQILPFPAAHCQEEILRAFSASSAIRQV